MKGYPSTVVEVLDPEMRFPTPVLAAVRRLAKDGPWRGSVKRRAKLFQRLILDLSAAYQIRPPTLVIQNLDGGSSGSSYYDRRAHQIVLQGRLSVTTALHEWGHVLAMDEEDACRWSINLFRCCFPDQFARSVHRGHMLLSPTSLISRSSSRRG